MKKVKAKEKTKLIDQLISKFFSIDGKVATLKLVYDTFAELVNQNFGDERTEKLNDRLFSDIKEAIEILPKTYKLNIEITIKDFGEYTREECERIIVQNVGLATYQAAKSGVGRLVNGLTLIGIGAALLIASYFLHSSKNDILFDIINISGTLFVWEGANTAFLERNLERKAMKKVAKTIQSIVVI